jgi:hypothetical protein
MLTSRELPREFWAEKLRGFALGESCHFLPTDAVIVVVERDDIVVACWSAIPVFQVLLEGAEILPDERKHASVARKLLLAMRSAVADNEVSTVLTGAQTDDVRAILATAGAERADMDLYSWPIGEGA